MTYQAKYLDVSAENRDATIYYLRSSATEEIARDADVGAHSPSL